ncbi:MAG: metal-dependent phosphohydrolase [Micrococcales bacterium]|nr:metal-dependent phosphohydrolase [Micrococcales bacterium]
MLRPMVYAAAGLLVALALWGAAAELPQVARVWPVLAVFALAIAVGQRFRLQLPEARRVAPMATASALALAMSVDVPGPGELTLGSGSIVIVIGIGLLAGALSLVAQGQPLSELPLLIRFVTLGLATVLLRSVPLHGSTLSEELAGAHDHPRGGIALALIVVAALAALLELVLDSIDEALRTGARMGSAVLDRVRTGGLPFAVLGSTGPLIALAEIAVGLAALPLFLVPLAVTQYAARVYAAAHETQRQTVRALAALPEAAGYSRTGHPDRVAEVALAIGRDLGLGQRALTSLEYAALLHDLGLVALSEPPPEGSTVDLTHEDQTEIARRSADVVTHTGAFTGVVTALDAMALPFRLSRELGQPIPLTGRILKVANAYADCLGDGSGPVARDRAVERLQLGLGYEYDPFVVEALARVVDHRPVALHQLH